MWLFKIIFYLISLILIWHFTTLKWRNPYKFFFYFGKKGVGKSTTLSKIAYENIKKGHPVYSQELLTFQIRDKKTHKKGPVSTIPFEPTHIYDYTYPAGSVILIDEASLLWSNRDVFNSDKASKKQMKRVIEWFQQMRKFKVSVHMFSVSFDIDKKLRDLCDEMYICNKILRCWTICRHVVRKPVIVHPQGEAPASIQEDIIEDGLLLAPFGGMRVTFIPYWSRYFDSFRVVVDSSGSDGSPSTLYPADALRVMLPVEVPDISSASSTQLVEPRILFENRTRRGLFSRKRNRMKTT